MLQNELQSKLTEIRELKDKVTTLESSFDQSEFKRESEKQTYNQTVNTLSESLNETTRKLQDRIGKCTNEFQQKEHALKKFCETLLKEKEENYNKNLSAIEGRLQEEVRSVSLLYNTVKIYFNRFKQILSYAANNTGLSEATVHVVPTLRSLNFEYFFWRVIGNVKGNYCNTAPNGSGMRKRQCVGTL
ncbi:hypothetical protein FQA39_LY16389 [Lamprigera yunnana]|nr:hypothetical protein FQA39_LY16389 [Lamprigera yunnana]